MRSSENKMAVSGVVVDLLIGGRIMVFSGEGGDIDVGSSHCPKRLIQEIVAFSRRLIPTRRVSPSSAQPSSSSAIPLQ
ncbi:unnamed protein product [Brassica oleracea]